MTLVSVNYYTPLCDPGCCKEASDDVATLKVDLDAYFTTNVLEIYIKNLGIRYSHMDVAIIVLAVGSVGVVVPGTVLGLCIATLLVAFGLNSIEGQQLVDMGTCSITNLVPYILAPGACIHMINGTIYGKY